MLTETWLRDHKDAEVAIKDYSLHRVDRSRVKKKRGRNSGGVAIYLHDTLESSSETLLRYSSGVIEAICIKIRMFDLIICNVYRQPNDVIGHNASTFEQFGPFLDQFSAVLESQQSPMPNILFCGDFNLPHASWPAGLPKAGSTPDERRMLDHLAAFCSRHFLTQLVTTDTHTGGNTLDLVFTSNPDLFPDVSFFPSSPISSHYMGVVESSLSSTQHYNLNCSARSKFDRLNFFSPETDWDSIKAKLAATDWPSLLENQSPTEMLQTFATHCEIITAASTPLRASINKSRQPKRVPRDRRIMMRKRTKLRKRFTEIKEDTRKSRIRNELIQLERKLQESYSLQAQNEECRAVDAIKSNSKYFYSYAKRHCKLRPTIGPLEDKDGRLTDDPKKMASILSDQYSSVFSAPFQWPLNLSHDHTPKLSDVTFDESHIQAAIEEISPSAAPGPDGFPAILLRECKEAISKPLYLMRRKYLDTGEIPDSLKISYITPIHKGESKKEAKNYRPVALTSHLIKLFEKVIRRTLVGFLEEHDLMNPNQHGFRSGRSCLSQLLQHHDRITQILEEGKNVDVIYLDYAKAFDKLDFRVTLQKLYNMGVSGNLFAWICSFLTNRYQCVSVQGEKSPKMPVQSGVPQGSVIGPLLFLVMISDIDSSITSVKVSSFADDTRVMAGISCTEDTAQLQSDLNKIYNWSEQNNAYFNPDKFECLRYGHNKTIIDSTVYYSNSGSIIDCKPSVKDLGILMGSDAKFAEHISRTAIKAGLKCGWILRTFKTRNRFPMLILWKSLVLPILDYCSQLWCPTPIGQINILEMVQVNYFRKISGLRDLDYWDQLRELKMYSLQRRRERYICLYVWKILEGFVPNFGIEVANNRRTGRYCQIPKVRPSAPYRLQTIRFCSMGVQGPRLFNCLPAKLRTMSGCSVDIFKRALDKHFESIPDEPRVSGLTKYCQKSSNSIINY